MDECAITQADVTAGYGPQKEAGWPTNPEAYLERMKKEGWEEMGPATWIHGPDPRKTYYFKRPKRSKK
jgi:hypothetical protein